MSRTMKRRPAARVPTPAPKTAPPKPKTPAPPPAPPAEHRAPEAPARPEPARSEPARAVDPLAAIYPMRAEGAPDITPVERRSYIAEHVLNALEELEQVRAQFWVIQNSVQSPRMSGLLDKLPRGEAERELRSEMGSIHSEAARGLQECWFIEGNLAGIGHDLTHTSAGDSTVKLVQELGELVAAGWAEFRAEATAPAPAVPTASNGNVAPAGDPKNTGSHDGATGPFREESFAPEPPPPASTVQPSATVRPFVRSDDENSCNEAELYMLSVRQTLDSLLFTVEEMIRHIEHVGVTGRTEAERGLDEAWIDSRRGEVFTDVYKLLQCLSAAESEVQDIRRRASQSALAGERKVG